MDGIGINRTTARLGAAIALATTLALAGGGTARAQDIGGSRVPHEFGSNRKDTGQEPAPAGTQNLGRKLKAGALSLVLPGAGQYYNGKHDRAFLMAGIEAGIWTAWLAFDHYADGRMASSREWAGLYAGTAGDHADSYWQNVGMFADSDAYNDSRYREARALGEDVSGLVGPGDGWQWTNEDNRRGYALLRAKGNSAYDRRDFMILFAVLNRAVSVFDAVIGAGHHDGGAQARVLGMDIDLQVNPVAADPYARCVVSRGF